MISIDLIIGRRSSSVGGGTRTAGSFQNSMNKKNQISDIQRIYIKRTLSHRSRFSLENSSKTIEDQNTMKKKILSVMTKKQEPSKRILAPTLPKNTATNQKTISHIKKSNQLNHSSKTTDTIHSSKRSLRSMSHSLTSSNSKDINDIFKPKLSCSHITSIRSEIVQKRLLNPSLWTCDECHTSEDVWICLTCSHVSCGGNQLSSRVNGTNSDKTISSFKRKHNHMIIKKTSSDYNPSHSFHHYSISKHKVILAINSMICWCYECKQVVQNDTKDGCLGLLREVLSDVQTQAYGASKTRSGKQLRSAVSAWGRIPGRIESVHARSNNVTASDKLNTAREHWNSILYLHVFRTWRTICQFRSYQRSMVPGSPLISSQSLMSPVASQSVSSLKKSSVLRGRTGLRNLGNTCYLNSLIQALASLHIFRDFFLSLPDTVGVEDNGKLNTNVNLNKDYSINEDIMLPPTLHRTSTEVLYRDAQESACVKKLKYEDLSLSAEIHNLLRILWSGHWASLTPNKLIHVLWKFVPQFRSYIQQDVHELLCYFLDRLEMELKGSPSTSPLYNQSFNISSNFISDIFESKMNSEILCTKCQNISKYTFPGVKCISLSLISTLEYVMSKENNNGKTNNNSKDVDNSKGKSNIFDEKEGKSINSNQPYVSLGEYRRPTRRTLDNFSLDDSDLKNNEYSGTISLSDLLSDCLRPITLTGESKYHCLHCDKRTVACKREYFVTLPCILIFHINRTVWNGRFRRKLSTHIDFPLTGLKMRVCNINSNIESDTHSVSTVIYDLSSIITHHGRHIDQGHYTALCRHPDLKCWLGYNDMKVSIRSEEEVLNSEGYLLFYEKRK